MQITEILITCYDGEKPVAAVSLESDAATMVFIQTDETGEAIVDESRQVPIDALTAFREALDRLVTVPATV